MSKRPFFRSRIEELRNLAEKAATDPILHRELLAELAHRKSRGAKKLESLLKELNSNPSEQATLSKSTAPSQQTQSVKKDQSQSQTYSSTSDIQEGIPTKKKHNNSYQSDQPKFQKKEHRTAHKHPGADDDGPLVTEEVPDDKPDHQIDNLINAMRLEIDAAKKSSIDTEIRIIGGTKIESSVDRHIYRFTLERDATIQEETPVEIVTVSHSANGKIIAVQDRSILIELREDMGDYIPFASIRQDATYLIKLLCEKFKAIKSGENTTFRKEMIEKILDHKKSFYSKKEPPDDIVLGDIEENQLEAIRLAMGSEIAWIWGPPGCGKSYTLVPIIEAFNKQDKRVLVCSNTNRAVDALLVKLCEKLIKDNEDDKFLKDGAVVRLGKIEEGGDLDSFAEQIDLERIVERKGEKLQQQKQEFERQLNEIDNRMRKCQMTFDKFSQLDSAVKVCTDAQSELNAANKTISENRIYVNSIESDVRRLNSDAIRKKEGGGFFDAIAEVFGGKTLEAIENDIHDLKIRLKDVSDEIETSVNGLVPLESRVTETMQKQDVLVQSLAGVNRQRLENMIKELADEERSIRPKLSKINEELSNLKNEILKNAQIIATTTTKTFTAPDSIGVFDIAIIDEASMLPLPHVVYVAGMAKSKVVVAGDFRQLPPIALGARDYELVKKWYGRDPFDASGIAKAVNDGKTPSGLAKLNVQFRSQPTLITPYNELFYSGSLNSDSDAGTIELPDGTKELPDPFPSLIDTPFTIIDTSDAKPCTSTPGRGRYNLLHAFTARNLIVALKAAQFPEDELEIGYITPYRLQYQLVEKMLDEAGIKNTKSGTVHRFQGSEASCIIYDTTESPPLSPSKFSTADNLKEDGAKLLNVALSRAKHRLVIIANMEFLRKKLETSMFLSQMFRILLRSARVIMSEELLDMLGPNALTSEAWSNHRISDLNLKGSIWLTDTNFHEAFMSDINQAEKHIVIYSGFATPQAVARIIEPLRARIQSGVTVRIVCRNPRKMGSIHPDQAKDALAILAEIGCHVDLRSNVHQKVIIIDGRILYIGSLNALSFRGGSEEDMLRCESPAACLAYAIQDRWRVPQGFNLHQEKPENVFDVFAQAENIRCPQCEGIMVYFAKGRFGPYLRCIDNDRHTLSVKNVGRNSSIDPDLKNKKQKCPACKADMHVRHGRRGLFWGCSGYPDCRETIDIGNHKR